MQSIPRRQPQCLGSTSDREFTAARRAAPEEDDVSGPGVADWSLWTTSARLVVTDRRVMQQARALIDTRLARIELAASRFRADSEVCRLADDDRDADVPVVISPTLADLVRVALGAAVRTGGAVDPTLGADLVALGYGAAPRVAGPASVLTLRRPISYRDIVLRDDDDDLPTIVVPPGVLLDLGATAKAHAADVCATEVADRLGCGVLLSLGGDLRVAGPPPDDGWGVLVQDGPDEPASHVVLREAQAVATSSTLHRVWQDGGATLHHILDPALRRPAPPVWRTVSVAAASCVEANTLSTAAVVRGVAARALLASAGAAARLVAQDGSVVVSGGWPA
jgi:FAD:protein FMN transferase